MIVNVEKIRELCKQNKEIRSLTRLEEILGFSNGYIGKLGKTAKMPPYDRLIKIANCLGVPISQLTGEENEQFCSVDRVKSICKEKNIPISRLEKDLGYANGYIGQLRKGTFPNDRLVDIAKYLNVSTAFLLGEDKENAPIQTDGRENITFDDFTYAMQNETKDLTDADKQLLLSMARQLNDARKQQNGNHQ